MARVLASRSEERRWPQARQALLTMQGRRYADRSLFLADANGWKITIMLEECGLPYRDPRGHFKGDQFRPAFLAISPNNRMPAIVDHQGPGGKPISIFESGAILQYLGRKTGKFYPNDERGRVEVEEWLFWQMANLGPKAGEANHFRAYASEKLPYAIERFSNEMNRIYGVMNARLRHREFLAGAYSIADMACVSWASGPSARHDLSGFARRWLRLLRVRGSAPVGQGGSGARRHQRSQVRAVLFNQRAR